MQVDGAAVLQDLACERAGQRQHRPVGRDIHDRGERVRADRSDGSAQVGLDEDGRARRAHDEPLIRSQPQDVAGAVRGGDGGVRFGRKRDTDRGGETRHEPHVLGIRAQVELGEERDLRDAFGQLDPVEWRTRRTAAGRHRYRPPAGAFDLLAGRRAGRAGRAGFAVAPRVLRIEQHGRRDLRLHRGAVEHRREHALSHPTEPALDHRERERPSERGALIRRRDVAEHRDRRPAEVRVGRDELDALRQERVGIHRQQADELLAVEPKKVGPHVRSPPDEVLLLRHDPVHAQVLRCDGPVGLLADDRIALLSSEHVQRLCAIRGDAVRGAGRHDGLPEPPAVPGRHIQLVRQLAGE